MRILWWGNAPWVQSGYGRQIAEVALRQQEDGHAVAILSNFGLQGEVRNWKGIPVFPSGWSVPRGPDALAHWVKEWDPDVIISLADVWDQDPKWWKDSTAGRLLLNWVPVERFPAPVGTAEWGKQEIGIMLPMSWWGQHILAYEGIRTLPYIPHSVAPHYTPGEKRKDLFGFPEDKRIFGVVAMNSQSPVARKAFPELLLAWRGLPDHIRKNSVLYLHTMATQLMGGLDLVSVIESLELEIGKDVLFPSVDVFYTGLDDSMMVELYRCFDVLLAPSMGEGFGIPVIEAQACGVPAAVTNFSAQPELLPTLKSNAGLPLRIPPGEYTPWWDPAHKSWMARPNPDSITTQINFAYNAMTDEDSSYWDACKLAAIVKASEYDADLLYEESWIPTMEFLNKVIEEMLSARLVHMEAAV